MTKINNSKKLVVSSIALILGSAGAEAALVTDVLGPPNLWSTDSANFTMLASNGGVVVGANDVNMLWDGSAYDNSSDYTGPGSASNVTLSSTTIFFGNNWVAHDIQMFLPGTYSFDTTLGGGNAESGVLTATVGAGQLGLHMLFDWGGNINIDTFMVFDQNSIFGSGLLYSTQIDNNAYYPSTCDAVNTGTITQNCLYDGVGYGSAGAPVKDQVWMLASADGNGDGVMGIPMAAGGPFAGFNWNYNAFAPAAAVPLPATAWLLGAGLLGLVSVVRRRKGAGSDIHSG